MSDQNQKPRNTKNKFWLKVAGVGLVAGLIGGGLSLGIGNVIENHVQTSSTNVPAGSNKSGGTKVNKNKANLSNQATKAYDSTKDAVVSVINKQEVQSSNQGIMGMFGGQTSGDSSNSDSSQNPGKLQTASEGSGNL